MTQNFGHRVAQIASVAQTAARLAAAERDGTWCELILISRPYGRSEPEEGLIIAATIARVNELGELVRVHFDNFDDVGLAVFRQALRMELEPFVVGVGQVRVDDSPDGIVILRRDIGEVHSLHTASSISENVAPFA